MKTPDFPPHVHVHHPTIDFLMKTRSGNPSWAVHHVCMSVICHAKGTLEERWGRMGIRSARSSQYRETACYGLEGCSDVVADVTPFRSSKEFI